MLTVDEYQKLIDISVELSCSLCKELFKQPQTLPCNHSFCKICVDNAIFKENACPECGLYTLPKEVKKSLILDNMVQAYTRFHSFVKVMESPPLTSCNLSSHPSMQKPIMSLQNNDSSLTRLSTLDFEEDAPQQSIQSTKPTVTRVDSGPTQIIHSRNDSLDRKRSFDSQLTRYSTVNTLTQSETMMSQQYLANSLSLDREGRVADTYAQNNRWEEEESDDQEKKLEALVAGNDVACNAELKPTDIIPSECLSLSPVRNSSQSVVDEGQGQDSVSESERKRRKRIVVPDTYAFEDPEDGQYVGEDLDDEGREDDFPDSPMIGSHYTYGTSWYNEEGHGEGDEKAVHFDDEMRYDLPVDLSASAIRREHEEDKDEEEPEADDWVEGYLTQGSQLLRTNTPAKTALPLAERMVDDHEWEPSQAERRIRFHANTAGSPGGSNNAEPIKSPLSGSFHSDGATQTARGFHVGSPCVVADTYAASSSFAEEEEEEEVEMDRKSSGPLETGPEQMMLKNVTEQQQDSSRTTLGERGLSFYDGSSLDFLQPVEGELPQEIRLDEKDCSSKEILPSVVPIAVDNAHPRPSQLAGGMDLSLPNGPTQSSSDQFGDFGPGLSQLSTCGYMEYQIEARKGAIERILHGRYSTTDKTTKSKAGGSSAFYQTSSGDESEEEVDEEVDEEVFTSKASPLSVGAHSQVRNAISSSCAAIVPSPPPPLPTTPQVRQEVAEVVVPRPVMLVISGDGLSHTQREWLEECCDRGWVRLLGPGEFLTNTESSSSSSSSSSSYDKHETHVLVVPAVGVRDGWALASRTLLYLKALCLGVLIVDAQWLLNSLEQHPNALSPLGPATFEVGGTSFDLDVKGPMRARQTPRDAEGRGSLLRGFSFSIQRPRDGSSGLGHVLLASPKEARNTISNNSVQINAGEVLWMAHMCGGRVMGVDEGEREERKQRQIRQKNSSSNNSYQSVHNQQHIILSLRLRQEPSIAPMNDTEVRIVSVSWLVDVICNQQLPQEEQQQEEVGIVSSGSDYNVPRKYLVDDFVV